MYTPHCILIVCITLSSISSFDIDEAKKYHEKEITKVYYQLPDGCTKDIEAQRWTGLYEEPQLRCISKGHGTAKVLLIGNSFGYRTFPVLHKLFNGRYAEFRLFTKSQRMFLNRDPKDNEFKYAEAVKELIRKSKPDIVFVIEKDMKADQNKAFTRLENDEILMYSQRGVNFLSENAKTVVIDDQYYKPNLGKGIAAIINDRLNNGKKSLSDFDDLRISRSKYREDYKFNILRFNALTGANVVKNRVQEQLCENEYCYFFNPENLHAYYGDGENHQTTEMIKKLEHGYKEIIEELLKHF